MKNDICVFVSEPGHLTWLDRHMKAFPGGRPRVFGFNMMPFSGVDTLLSPTAVPEQIVRDVMTDGRPSLVMMLTNQAGLIRDAMVGALFEGQGVLALYQPEEVAKLGADKILMKERLKAKGIAVTPGVACESLEAALDNFTTGKRYVLKRPGLSDSRMMRVVNSHQQINQYYYDFDISGPTLMEEFIDGIEYSCAAINLCGRTLAFPPAFKGRTNYLAKTGRSGGRFYVIDRGVTNKVHPNLERMVTQAAQAIGSQWLLGLDMVVVDNQPMVIEVNTRVVETLRMSILSVGRNVLLEAVKSKLGKSSIDKFTEIRCVADMPLDGGMTNMGDNSNIVPGCDRISIGFEEKKELLDLVPDRARARLIISQYRRLVTRHEQ